MRMRLPCDLAFFHTLTLSEIVASIWLRRTSIRNHRDQVLHDRCFLDDWLVWQWLDDTPPMPHFSDTTDIVRCQLYWRNRRSTEQETCPGGLLNPEQYDSDLDHLSKWELERVLYRLQLAIKRHRDIPWQERTRADDLALYFSLPEMLPGAGMLPGYSEFFGLVASKGTQRAGCLQYWDSHKACSPATCNLHKWGPCPPEVS